MKDKNSIKFNFNDKMAKYLIEFNKLKKKINIIKQNEELNEMNLIKLQRLEEKLNSLRSNFIIEFRKNNKKSIQKYLANKEEKVSEK